MNELVEVPFHGESVPLRSLIRPDTTLFDLLFGTKPVSDGRGRKGWIYCGESRGQARIKIGFTTNLPQRMKGLQREARPNTFAILCVFAGDEAGEKELHQRFSALRLFGEWFRDGAPLRKFVQERLRGGASCPSCPSQMKAFRLGGGL